MEEQPWIKKVARVIHHGRAPVGEDSDVIFAGFLERH